MLKTTKVYFGVLQYISLSCSKFFPSFLFSNLYIQSMILYPIKRHLFLGGDLACEGNEKFQQKSRKEPDSSELLLSLLILNSICGNGVKIVHHVLLINITSVD